MSNNVPAKLYLISLILFLFTGFKASRVSVWRASSSSFIVESVDKLHIFMLYFFGLFALAFQHLRRGVMRLKPVKVEAALT